MTLYLPTDTHALRLETKQYELFNKRLGNGIPRRNGIVCLTATAIWVGALIVLGVPFFTRFGPTLYLVPPFAVSFFAMRPDESGRLAFMRWYDWVLIRHPHRRRPVTNPLLPPRPPTVGALIVLVSTVLCPPIKLSEAKLPLGGEG